MNDFYRYYVWSADEYGSIKGDPVAGPYDSKAEARWHLTQDGQVVERGLPCSAAGCRDVIADGKQGLVTVGGARAVTVQVHDNDGCRKNAREHRVWR